MGFISQMPQWRDENYSGTVRFPVMTSKGGTRMRTYPVYGDSPLVSTTVVSDTASPYLRLLAKNLPNELNKALASVGLWLKGEIQDAAYNEDPPNSQWEPLSEIHRDRVLDDLKGNMKDPATHPFGDLVRAVGYKRDKAKMQVEIGWLSKAAAGRGYMLQKGEKTPVTDKMRRFFAAAGLPIPQKDVIIIPARDLIGTVFQAREPKIEDHITSKIYEYLNHQAAA